MSLARTLLVIVLTVSGCDGFGEKPLCGPIEVPVSKVYVGTYEPTVVPLQPGQILAIGNFGFCTGTLIAPRWVLTAQHCPLEVGHQFCMGVEPEHPNVCISATRLVHHADVDVTLVELSEDASTRLPQVRSIPIMTEPLTCELLGTMAEAAGYGKTEVGERGTRYFSAEPIVKLTGSMLTVDGAGQRGLCRGDSGGPVMIVDDAGTVRVAGALSFGDASCRGTDEFTRTDTLSLWIRRQIRR